MRKNSLIIQEPQTAHSWIYCNNFLIIGTLGECQYSQDVRLQIPLSARLSKNGPMVLFCLEYFPSSTHFHLVTRLAQKAWRQCSDFCARSSLSCWKLHWPPFGHWPFSFHWWQVPFHPSTLVSPFRLLTTTPFSILPCLASKFRNRSFWSILLSTMFENFW